MPAAIEAVRRAFGRLATGRAHVPLRLSVPGEGGELLVMPGALAAGDGGEAEDGPDGGGPALGAKAVSVFPGNPDRGLPRVNAVVLLLDPGTGAPRALLAANHLTALRTGAASGVATDLLARRDASVLAVFGAGVQARSQVAAVRAVRPIREVRVVSRGGASAEALARELQEVGGLEAHASRVPAAALRDADVVVAATDSASPVFDGADVEPGTHVNGIGSYTPQMQEVDATLLERATVVVDDREAALEEAGDLVVPIGEGRFRPEDVHAALGEVVEGLRPARSSRNEITFFKSVGSAVQDLAVATLALEEADSRGLGKVVEL